MGTASDSPTLALHERPIACLRGVGPALAERLKRLGINTVQDLLFTLPRHYEDRTQRTALGSLIPGMTALVEADVVLADIIQGRRRALLVRLRDGTGGLTLRFYHFRQSQKDSYSKGQRLRVFGEVRAGPAGPEMIHPEVEWLADTDTVNDDDARLNDHLTPIYPLVEGLTQRRIRELMARALPLLNDTVLIDKLPAQQAGGWSLAQALHTVHAPTADSDRQALRDGLHPAQQRLVFEELVAHQMGLLQRRDRQRHTSAPALRCDDSLSQQLLAALPFALTDAQQRVVQEIHRDLGQTRAMLRLVQGDVGAGKTVVAALAACPALAAGLQVAIMAPTEILAEQHLLRFRSWFDPLGISVGWLSGKQSAKSRTTSLASLADASCQLVIGTHALFQDSVQFARLGLVIIDEQHRFGVAQRLQLAEKGLSTGWLPHQLIMTATPIPRTLAMSAYGDLDTSIIDALPPGRQGIQTVVLANTRRDTLVERIRHHAASGQQVYWVCTLIEQSEQIQAQAAEAAMAELSAALPELKVGLVHGQLKAAEKAAVMADFVAGNIAVLVATTVIEVGVDVPNATLMVIENPERLGLSQLHQLRGRVGRGQLASFCVLLYQTPVSALARERLQILRDSQDGFVIAEKDLELRGPGEVLGTRQTGDVQFRLADLVRDAALISPARALAERLHGHENYNYLLSRWLSNEGHYALA
ncbi:ATP-dependent DNA helicase RecG [Paraperlucidibaca wandonensis]|uniref:ATP-dependent DNA helicase RecG n=1 Tax=Paraperlucidibaca wandonensis TaxID=1268273 RepID=A0ABW3HIR6_9GAMM